MSYVESQYGKFNYFPLDCIGMYISRGVFWDECLRPYMDALQPGDVYIDVGANIGFFPVYLGKRGIDCHAFEASPELADMLNSNLVLNGVDGKVYNVALYDHETDLVLHRDWRAWAAETNGKPDYNRSGNSGWLCLVPEEIGEQYNKFHARTLDSYGIADVKLIKIDTQGCDLRVLHGAKATISTYRPVVLFEYEDFVSVVHGDTWDKYEEFWKDLNYNIKRIGTVEWVAEPKENEHV